MLLARLVRAALLIAAVSTVVTTVAPVRAAYAETIITGELVDAAGPARAVLTLI